MMTLNELNRVMKEISHDLALRQTETRVEQNGRWFHVFITAGEFRGRSQGERENLIWREFERRLDDEAILSVTQCYLLTPEEQAAEMPLTITPEDSRISGSAAPQSP